jgi:hypothetical protein
MPVVGGGRRLEVRHSPICSTSEVPADEKQVQIFCEVAGAAQSEALSLMLTTSRSEGTP